ncbi:MAG: hypothetical protein HQK84_02345 [Nitrospinae bacterium]|nr:hypothetical protein [Nitrospinota bacterium]
MRKKLFISFGLFFTLCLYGLYIHKTNDGVEFCHSCHLNTTTKLHDEEYNNFVAVTPNDLAGFHKIKKARFTCIDCHKGSGWKTTLLNDTSAFINLGKYILNTFSDTTPLRYPMEDAICKSCHDMKIYEHKSKKFHGLIAHKQPFNIKCVNCHWAHKEGKGNYYFLQKEALSVICAKCHKNLESSKFKRIFIDKNSSF